ncbi:autotransporter domain-containing protein [Methylorubrum thiocyanatum]|uniref:autotransporter domain-containing protein n=1 Tax=Methylorubrum thiocyanatum TaxID=47958 RepID=UPI00383A4CED
MQYDAKSFINPRRRRDKATARSIHPPAFKAIAILLASAAPILIAASAANAQSRYTSLTAFGDSYADSGINNFLRVLGNPSAYPTSGASPAVVAAINPYVAFPYWIQSQLGLSDAQVTNYAIGGSTTQTLNAYGVEASLPYQLSRFGARTFGPRDLVAISIGGNDGLSASGAIYPLLGFGPTGQQFTPTAAVALGIQSAANATAAVNQLAAAGARNVIFAGFSDFTALPQAVAAPFPGNLTLYSQTYFQSLQTDLAPLARAGVRIFLVDETRLVRQIGASLGTYGFGSYQYVGASTQSLFQPEGIHLTARGFQVLASYMTNLLSAPDTVAPQAEVAQLAGSAFAGSLFRRLDAIREFGGYGTQSVPIGDKGPRTAAAGASATSTPLSLFIEGSHLSGGRNDRVGADGFDHDLNGVTFGATARVDANLLVGGAFNYTNVGANLRHRAGRIDMDAYQFAGFASLTHQSWFADLVATYGRDDLRLQRQGVLDPVRGRTSGDTVTAGGRAGYLFEAGPFRIGPIASLNYVRSGIGRYTETGDPLLTFTVAQPDLDSLTVGGGIQIRLPFAVGTGILNPYLNMTAEHDLIGGNRTIVSTETQAPLLPIQSQIPGLTGRTYGKFAGGLLAQVSDVVGVTLTGVATVGRAGGNDFGVSGGVRLSF